MKRAAILFFIAGLLASGASHAGEDPVSRAAKFYKMNRYEEAVNLHRFLGDVGPREKGRAFLSLGIFFLSDSVLHAELHEAALAVNLDYLGKVASVSKNRSRMVNLYMAENLIERGNYGQAVTYFNKLIMDKKVGARYKAVAKAGLGLALHLKGQKRKAGTLWSGLTGTKDPLVLSELAAAYSRAGMTERNPSGMCGRALEIMRKRGENSIRVINNAVGVYARSGEVGKGLELIRNADLKAYSHEESPGKNKVIRFYAPSLLGNISRLYAKASILYLKKALEASTSEHMAMYYLSEAYSRLGMVDDVSATSGSVLSSRGAPKKFRGLAKIRQAEALYRKGKRNEAVKLLEGLSGDYPGNPLMQAEVLLACGTIGADCNNAVSRAASLAQAGEGRKFARLNHALGKYHLVRKDYDRAISYMEAGRDKSNKNRIESNDPAMLVNLAEAYYAAKNFSEALEIFFEMSKHFPALRQIQVALQGIYSVEQKSAGDVKVL